LSGPIQQALTPRPDDSFPRDEFGKLIRHIPNYGRLAWALANDPRLSRARRAAVMAAAAYVISPVDLVPGIIPVLGQLDDVLIALGAIRLALNGLRPEFRAQVLANAGLTAEDLDADLRRTGHIAAWLGRSSVRVSERIGRGVADYINRRVRSRQSMKR
jgi:uncharacterized membrane protein YkvA (DUF1232 family)